MNKSNNDSTKLGDEIFVGTVDIPAAEGVSIEASRIEKNIDIRYLEKSN